MIQEPLEEVIVRDLEEALSRGGAVGPDHRVGHLATTASSPPLPMYGRSDRDGRNDDQGRRLHRLMHPEAEAAGAAALGVHEAVVQDQTDVHAAIRSLSKAHHPFSLTWDVAVRHGGGATVRGGLRHHRRGGPPGAPFRALS